MINEYIKNVCEILKITPPDISYDISHFPTKTTLAQCSSDGTTIYLRHITLSNPDDVFAIAHELRHIWQIRNDYDEYFTNYKTSDEIGVEAYNNQLAEIDANAFATIIMTDLFKLRPLYNGLSKRTVDNIMARIDIVLKSLQQL